RDRGLLFLTDEGARPAGAATPEILKGACRPGFVFRDFQLAGGHPLIQTRLWLAGLVTDFEPVGNLCLGSDQKSQSRTKRSRVRPPPLEDCPQNMKLSCRVIVHNSPSWLKEAFPPRLAAFSRETQSLNEPWTKSNSA